MCVLYSLCLCGPFVFLYFQSKSLTDRHLINEAVRRGITVGNQKSSVKISSTLANEILQLSDALDLNEKTVLGLLFSAEKQLPRYPRYSKMQVAAVLYHEGRLSAMTALRSLIQAREGNTWSSTLNYQVNACTTNLLNILPF